MKTGLVVLIASVYSASCSKDFLNKHVDPTAYPGGCVDQAYSYAKETIEYVNTLRLSRGVPVLLSTEELMKSGALHAQDMVHYPTTNCESNYYWSGRVPVEGEDMAGSECCADISNRWNCIHSQPSLHNYPQSIQGVEEWITGGQFDYDIMSIIRKNIDDALIINDVYITEIVESLTAKYIGAGFHVNQGMTYAVSIFKADFIDQPSFCGFSSTTASPTASSTESVTTEGTATITIQPTIPTTTPTMIPTTPPPVPEECAFPTDAPTCNLLTMDLLNKKAFEYTNEIRNFLFRDSIAPAVELFGTAALHVQDLVLDPPRICLSEVEEYKNYRWSKFSPLTQEWREECCVNYEDQMGKCIDNKVAEIYNLPFLGATNIIEIIIESLFEIQTVEHVESLMNDNNMKLAPVFADRSVSMGVAVKGRYMSFFVSDISLTPCFPLVPTTSTTTTSSTSTTPIWSLPIEYIPTEWPVEDCNLRELDQLVQSSIDYINVYRVTRGLDQLIPLKPLLGTAAYHVQDLANGTLQCIPAPGYEVYSWSPVSPGQKWEGCCSTFTDVSCTSEKPNDIYGAFEGKEFVMVNRQYNMYKTIESVQEVLKLLEENKDSSMFRYALEVAETKYVGVGVGGSYISVYTSTNGAPIDFCE